MNISLISEISLSLLRASAMIQPKLNFCFLPVICSVLLSSCATLFNGPFQKINLITDAKVKVISVEKAVLSDSSASGPQAPISWYVPRSDSPLIIHLEVDSQQTQIQLKPVHSFAYWSNVYFNYGIGMLIDRDTKKRFAYPTNNYLFLQKSSVRRESYIPGVRQTCNLSVILPVFNVFDLKSPSGRYRNAGIFGLQTGLDYFYRENRYLSIEIGVATDRGPVEYFGKGYVETGSVMFAGLKNSLVTGRFDFGYGISFLQLKWRQTTIGDTTDRDQTYRNTGPGILLSAEYRLGRHFHLGIQYLPGYLKSDFTHIYSYQHFFSLNLVWKLSLKH